MYDHAIVLWIAVSTIIFLDLIQVGINRLNYNLHRWFWLHAIVNFIVAACALPDLISVVQRIPQVPILLPETELFLPTWEVIRIIIPKNFTLMLHIYHIIMFRNLQMIDWIHHIVMCAILLLTYTDPAIRITNSIIFFVNGLPGGIDYVMLLLVKQGSMRAISEKYYNNLINTWIRSPGILFGTCCGYFNWNIGMIKSPVWIPICIISALYWNAQYFSNRVSVNYGQSRNKNRDWYP